jgi:hypothetical protein
MPLLVIIAIALFCLVDWQNVGAGVRNNVKRNAALFETTAPQRTPDEQLQRGFAWCRSISHYDEQYRWCADRIRSGALIAP